MNANIMPSTSAARRDWIRLRVMIPLDTELIRSLITLSRIR